MDQAGTEGSDPRQTAPLDGQESADETHTSAPLGMDARQLARTFIGRNLGDYHVVREIGHGSMGIVFEAVNERLQQTVALKVLPPSLSVTTTVIKRFLREAQSVAKLSHENIVQIFTVGDQDGVFFYAMQYIEGSPLDAVLRERRLTPLECATIVAQAARALYFAHENGIIHRDVKPANIILSYKDRPILTDFGLARPEKAGTLTESGALVGTPIYMSPEQVRGDRTKIDRRTDIYSLGVTFYEVLTGVTPFEADSTQEILQKIESQDPRPVRRVNPRIHRDLETICHRAIDKDPERRYQTALELALDLERFLGGEAIHARRTSVATRLVRKARRHKVIAALASVLVLAMIIILVSGLRGREARQEANRARRDRSFIAGSELVSRHQWASAIAEFDQAIAADPTQVEAFIERGKCHYMEMSHEMAVADFNAALALDPTNGRARLWRGLSRCRFGNSREWSEGFLDIKETLHENPDDPECLLEAARLGLELAESGRNREARDMLFNVGYERIARLLEINPNDDSALVVQALYMRAEGLDGLARQTLEKAVLVNPHNSRAWSLLSDEAEAAAETAAVTDEAGPESVMRKVAPWWGILAARGLNWASREITPEAEYLTRAVDALALWDSDAPAAADSPPASDEPGAVDIEQQLADADAFWAAGRTSLAAPIYLEILSHNPKLAEPNNRLAEYYLTTRRDLQLARKHVDRARQIAPANPRTLFVALQVYSAQEDREKLRLVIEDIRAYYPNFLTLPYVSDALEKLGGERKL